MLMDQADQCGAFLNSLDMKSFKRVYKHCTWLSGLGISS